MGSLTLDVLKGKDLSWLLGMMADAMLIFDREGRIRLSNPAAQALFGYGDEELLMHTVEELIPHRYRGAHAAKRCDYVKDPGARIMGLGMETFGLRRDGAEFHADVSLAPLENGLVLATIRDVSHRKQSLIAAREYAESIVATIQEPLLVLDQDYRVVSANGAFYRDFRLSPEETEGQLFYELHGRLWDIPELRHLLSEVLPAERTVEGFELAHDFPGLGVRTLRLNACRVVGKVEERRLVLVAMEDITEQKRLQTEQSRIIHELECANEELRNFAHVVSHDLKAPLRGISSLADWIAADQKDRLDTDGQNHLRLLIQRVHRMDALIDGVLEYSRVGRLHEAVAEVDLNTLVHEVVDLLAPPASVTVDIKHGLPSVRTEKTQIQQVFQNLLSNAIRFLDKPEGRIVVDCREEGNMWIFSVGDNGPGIEPRHCDRIFQLFQTLGSRDRCESTGVGLAIVKKIVDHFGGRVWVESVVGEGSRFFFTVPKTGGQTS